MKDAKNQARRNRLKENPLGSIKFERVAILVLGDTISFRNNPDHRYQPERVEGDFLVSSQNVVTKLPTNNIHYFQDEYNDQE